MPLALKESESNEQAAAICASQYRADRAPTPGIRADRSEVKGRMVETDEGYLRGNAIVTRTGVFEYMNMDGTIRRELRHPDDVFDAASLETLAMIPVTVEHPSELVTSETAEQLSVGQTGEMVKPDGKYLIVPFTITSKRGIDAVRGGKQELSLGYTTETIPESGEYNGQPYDYRQTNIRYNHLAIVDRARAGGAARINMDGAAVQSINHSTNEEATMPNPVQVTLDGISYDAAPEVAKALEKAQSELASVRADAGKSKADMQKQIDEYQAKIDALEEEMGKMKADSSDEAIASAVAKRLDLERGAAKLVAEPKFDGLSDRDVMIAAVQEVRENFDASDKGDDYIRAAFDLAIESAGDENAIAKQRKDTAEPVEGNGAPKSSMRGDQARLDALQKLSRGGE